MQILYKRIKTLQPHCGDCGERLSGNGSIVLPYQCSCGIWEIGDYNRLNEYVLKDQCACSVVSGRKNPAFSHHSKYECRNNETGVLRA